LLQKTLLIEHIVIAYDKAVDMKKISLVIKFGNYYIALLCRSIKVMYLVSLCIFTVH